MLNGIRILGSTLIQESLILQVIAGLILRVVVLHEIVPEKSCWPKGVVADKLPSLRFPLQENDAWLSCFLLFLGRLKKHRDGTRDDR